MVGRVIALHIFRPWTKFPSEHSSSRGFPFLRKI
jgi:hypothetical protein